MTDSYVQLPPDSTGKKLRLVGPLADGSYVEGVLVTDQAGDAYPESPQSSYMTSASLAPSATTDLDATLITEINPPPEVDSALAAINTAHNQVSSDISLAQATADQKIVQSRRAVEIETLKAQAEVEPIKLLAAELSQLQHAGPGVLEAYLRNVRLKLYEKAADVYLEANR